MEISRNIEAFYKLMKPGLIPLCRTGSNRRTKVHLC